MNGVDVDWENDVSTKMTQAQFNILLSTLRQVFDVRVHRHLVRLAMCAATDVDWSERCDLRPVRQHGWRDQPDSVQ